MANESKQPIHKIARYEKRYHNVTYYWLYSDGTMKRERSNLKEHPLKAGFKLAMVDETYNAQTKTLEVLFQGVRYKG